MSFEELLEDAKLLALPTLWEMPEGIVAMRHTLMTVKLRRLFMFLSAPELCGLVVFSQQTLVLLVREKATIYLGYRGVNTEGNRKQVMEKSRFDGDALKIDFWNVRPRADLIAIIQPAQ